jgi:hypothetical protein
MKKISAMLLVSLIAVATSLVLIHPVNAIHEASISWIDDGNGVWLSSTVKAFPGAGALGGFNATFEVYNFPNSSDKITNVRVVIDRTTSGVLFHFVRGFVYRENFGAVVPYWVADPTEFDTQKGWPGTVIFRAFPENAPSTAITQGEKYWFVMVFSEGPSSCNYPNALKVYTEDAGLTSGSPETRMSGVLGITVDNMPPAITTVPVDGGTVNGISYACGVHYFNLSVTANDAVADSVNGIVHDTGISNVSITIDGVTFKDYVSVGVGPGGTWTLPSADSMVLNLASGTHVLVVTAWDGVGNSATVTVTFTYNPPLMPAITVTPTSGTSALKSWYDSTSGLVLSEQMNYSTYREKVLGTLVTVSGVYFDSGVAVTVEIDMPTYPTSPIVVAKTTTQSDGSFSTTFVFPQAPAGIYNIMVYSTPCNLPAIFEVLPEVIFKPDYVVGPALIEVIATGFTAQNTTRPSWMLMFPDALQGVNTQIDRWWFIDGNGTLRNWLNTYTAGVENVSTTLNWPWMNPGSNTIEIKHFDGDWWNGPGMNWVYTPCFIGNNTITVKETLSLLIDINAKLDYLKPIIERIDGNVVTISTTAGRIEATINQLSPVITRIDGNVVTINTIVGQINTTMATIGPQLAAIGPDIATIKTSVGTGLSGTVTSIQGDVATIKTDAGDVHAQLPNITNYIIVVIVLTLIAALAAIACVFLVFRKIA